MDNKVKFPQVNKSVELVQVLIYLSQEQSKTYQKLDNSVYVENISAWFDDYKNHKAVELTKKLICENHFVHIIPLKAILAIDKIIEDEKNTLYDWANAVKEFYQISNFEGFIKSQESYYQEIMSQIDIGLFMRCKNYVEKLYKKVPSDFNVLISPITGNYGFNIGDKTFSVIYGNLNFNNFQFARSIVHEYSHCFVNPIVELNLKLLAKHKDFFEQHQNMLSFYNTDYAVINEYIVRAVVIMFLKNNPAMYSPSYIEEEILRQKKTFLYIEIFLLAIEQYTKSELSFEEFYISSISDLLKVKL